MNFLAKQWTQESTSEAHRKERKAEFVRRLSGSIKVSTPALYRMNLSGCPAYFHLNPLASEYHKGELLGAVMTT
jgi:hypothetical protein